jgi:hypothetical protein
MAMLIVLQHIQNLAVSMSGVQFVNSVSTAMTLKLSFTFIVHISLAEGEGEDVPLF